MTTNNSLVLAGKVAIITGASAGIGESIAKLLTQNGCNVALGARRLNKLEELKRQIDQNSNGRNCCVIAQTDVTKRSEVRALVKLAEQTFGPVDILINNAGIMPLSFMKNLHEDEWDQMVDVNIKGVLNGVGAVLKGMLERNRGDIINISSDAGRKVFKSGTVYSGTKWFVEALTQGLRLETEGTALRITSIQPGATTSELAHSITDNEVKQMFSGSTMRFLDSDDVARAVLYVCTQPPHCSINEVMIRSVEQRS
eukprot:TRINITY_DN424_c4_g1_i1.p1 TRINITY_DN424_c4_g1~~TRINITY_DN424_c4_g1_i1.p1  ORF type:complete len:255 (+),score=142.87 TRINITY_DN424_c4_g1_i1:90-854(+)